MCEINLVLNDNRGQVVCLKYDKGEYKYKYKSIYVTYKLCIKCAIILHLYWNRVH